MSTIVSIAMISVAMVSVAIVSVAMISVGLIVALSLIVGDIEGDMFVVV